MINLITGIHGLAGSHLADLLVGKGEQVYGLARSLDNSYNVTHLKNQIQVLKADICDPLQVKQVLESVQPDAIYHLAGMSYVPTTVDRWGSMFDSHFKGTLNLLESARQLNLKAKMLWVGSSEEYGIINREEGLVDENHPLKPFSLYGVSKSAAELLANSYHERGDLEVVRVRSFNHIGPRQDCRFVVSSFARQIAEIEADKKPVLKVGNLESERDFTDVRDTVRAYFSVIKKGKSGEVYNVCSGTDRKIRDVLMELIRQAGVSIEIKSDEERFRPNIPVNLGGDFSRLKALTGWQPEIPLEKSLEDILAFWREKLQLRSNSTKIN